MQMTETMGQFVVFVKRKKKEKGCCVNLEEVINSSDLYMSFGNLRNKQRNRT